MKHFLLIIGFIFFVTNSFCQTKDILLTIGTEKTTSDEFLRIYNKNNNSKSIEKKSPEEYLEMFIDYKLKVQEAKENRLDTSVSFQNEYKSYTDQLIKPYLTDQKTENRLMKEAYERMLYDIRASHILVKLPLNPTPMDTLAAYKKIKGIKRRISKGESFEQVAKGTSDDPSVKTNGGDLGYFTVFQMVYPFETAAYNTPVNHTSKPFRTRFGYHILKVHDKRKAMGELKVAHIMLTTPKDMSKSEKEKVKSKITDIYKQLKSGADFTYLAKTYSQDRGSAKNGGELNWFGTGRMISEFELAASKLKKNGDISEPVQTSYGWHVIKRIDKKELPEKEEAKKIIKSKLIRDTRYHLSETLFIKKLKNQYKYKMDSNTLTSVLNILDTSIFVGNWTPTKPSNAKNTLFDFANQKIPLSNFIDFMNKNQRTQSSGNLWQYAQKSYDKFVFEQLLAYEKTQLPKKNKDLKYLLKEYYEGLMLFDIMDKKIWTKAGKDKEGINKFYTKNKNKYTWGERMYISNFYCPTLESFTKLKKLAEKKNSKNLTNKYILKKVNKKIEDSLKVRVTEEIYNKKDNNTPTNIKWEKGTHISGKEGSLFLLRHVDNITIGEQKDLKDCKGLVIADYQNKLEQEWLKALHEKFEVKINEKVFSKIKEEISKQKK